MPLKGKKPEEVQKRFKALFYGIAGAGKTTAAIQFPQPYIIDTERGAENDQYVKKINDAKGALFQSNDFDEILSEVKALLSEKHPYRTLVIDPLTTVYNSILDKAADEVGTDFGRHKGPTKRKMNHLLSLLVRLDMNVIITSHAKPKWVRTTDSRGKETAVQEGNTFDCLDSLDYLFDLVLEVERRGNDRVATVRKTRLVSFPERDTIDFSYDAIAERYGRNVLEKKATPEILATETQIAELARLIDAARTEPKVVEKWLDKSNSASFAEMPGQVIQACIDATKKKLTEAAGAA